MPVIVQIASASTGGIGRLTRDISDVLSERNIENYIAYGRGELLNSKRDFMFGTKADVLKHAFLTRLTDKAGLYSKRATYELVEFLEEKKPDLVQIHNLHGYYVNYEILFEYLKSKNIPTVWTLHDCWAFTGHCAYFDAAKCEKWKSGCCNCPTKNEYPSSYLFDNSADNFSRKKNTYSQYEKLVFVTPSKWLADTAKKSFLKERDFFVINNGIDLNVFKRVEPNNEVTFAGMEQKKIVLGVASTWAKRKGLEDFIKLSKVLPEEYVIVLVGVSKKQRTMLPRNIIGIEHTENVEELVRLYNKAHVFLNLTYEDNFPTTNLEALACGTSVLTYRTGGSPESIDENVGYVVNQGDLSSVLKCFFFSSRRRHTISECLKKSKQYNKVDCFLHYYELYCSLLKIDKSVLNQ